MKNLIYIAIFGLIFNCSFKSEAASKDSSSADIKAAVWQLVENGQIKIGQPNLEIWDAFSLCPISNRTIIDDSTIEITKTFENLKVTFSESKTALPTIVAITETLPYGDPMIAALGNYFKSINGEPSATKDTVAWNPLPKDHNAVLILIKSDSQQTVTILLTHNLLPE